jgi:hypothetical protein
LVCLRIGAGGGIEVFGIVCLRATKRQRFFYISIWFLTFNLQ